MCNKVVLILFSFAFVVTVPSGPTRCRAFDNQGPQQAFFQGDGAVEQATPPVGVRTVCELWRTSSSSAPSPDIREYSCSTEPKIPSYILHDGVSHCLKIVPAVRVGAKQRQPDHDLAILYPNCCSTGAKP